MRKIVPKTEKGMTDTPSKAESKPIYPSFRIELTHLPEAKKWELGKNYSINLDLTMTGISISRYQNDAEFEIKGIGVESPAEQKVRKEENN